MERDVVVSGGGGCKTYNYGDALYWDARYLQQQNNYNINNNNNNSSGCFDWYQQYSALRPLIRRYIPKIPTSPILIVGCGNASLSEDMVKDGYEEIMNVDISSVVIDMMRRKYEHILQLKYMQMDVRDMSFFPDASFAGIVDKGTLDSLMCGTDAPISVARMLGEVSRVLKLGGIYILITYGDPIVRIPHLNRPAFCWKIELYIIPRSGFQKSPSSTSTVSVLEPISTTETGLLPPEFVLEDPESHFIYICKKDGGG